MWDNLYSRLIERVPYKRLVLIPPLISLLMIGVLLVNGMEMGLEFKGGTWVEVLTEKDFTEAQLSEINSQLSSRGLEDVDSNIGWDVDTGKNKLTVTTTTVLSEGQKKDLMDFLSRYTGSLREYDEVSTRLDEKPSVALEEKLNNHLDRRVSVSYNQSVLSVSSLNLDPKETQGALEYYLNKNVSVDYSRKNFNLKTVGATLGDTFRSQGFKAVLVAFGLMAVVIFIAFRDLIPSFAVMLAAFCDIVLTLGGMSLLGFPLEPASLAAVLMLIGYSVDSDILLTVRVLKRRRGEVDERINDAMKTGLTMTGTTLSVMIVVYAVSSTLTQIVTLKNIASVLLIGLFGDLFTTWFTNAGLLKWYIEEKKGGRR